MIPFICRKGNSNTSLTTKYKKSFSSGNNAASNECLPGEFIGQGVILYSNKYCMEILFLNLY